MNMLNKQSAEKVLNFTCFVCCTSGIPSRKGRHSYLGGVIDFHCSGCPVAEIRGIGAPISEGVVKNGIRCPDATCGSGHLVPEMFRAACCRCRNATIRFGHTGIIAVCGGSLDNCPINEVKGIVIDSWRNQTQF